MEEYNIHTWDSSSHLLARARRAWQWPWPSGRWCHHFYAEKSIGAAFTCIPHPTTPLFISQSKNGCGGGEGLIKQKGCGRWYATLLLAPWQLFERSCPGTLESMGIVFFRTQHLSLETYVSDTTAKSQNDSSIFPMPKDVKLLLKAVIIMQPKQAHPFTRGGHQLAQRSPKDFFGVTCNED